MTRRRALWLLGATTVILLAILALLDFELRDTGGPGIIPFELAGSTERAQEILSDWGDTGHDAARLSLWLDFPYLLAYGAFFSLAVLALRDAARRRGWTRLARPGTVIAALPPLAAACDAVENVNLLLVLDGHADSAAPELATGFALAKFAFLAPAQVYLAIGLVALAVTWLREVRKDRSQGRQAAD